MNVSKNSIFHLFTPLSVCLAGSPNESGFMVNKRAMYEPGAVMVCSQKRACCVVSMGFVAIIAVALIVAFTKPGNMQSNLIIYLCNHAMHSTSLTPCPLYFVFLESACAIYCSHSSLLPTSLMFEFAAFYLYWHSMNHHTCHPVSFFLKLSVFSRLYLANFYSRNHKKIHNKEKHFHAWLGKLSYDYYNDVCVVAGCPEATYTGEPVAGFSSRPTSSPPTTPPTATNGEEFPWTDVRLPFHVKPLHYNITLHPNLTTRHVDGRYKQWEKSHHYLNYTISHLHHKVKGINVC